MISYCCRCKLVRFGRIKLAYNDESGNTANQPLYRNFLIKELEFLIIICLLCKKVVEILQNNGSTATVSLYTLTPSIQSAGMGK